MLILLWKSYRICELDAHIAMKNLSNLWAICSYCYKIPLKSVSQMLILLSKIPNISVNDEQLAHTTFHKIVSVNIDNSCMQFMPMCRTNERNPQKPSFIYSITDNWNYYLTTSGHLSAMCIPSLTLSNWYNNMVCPEVGYLYHQKYYANNPYYICVCVMRNKLSATQNLPAPSAFTFLIQINKLCKIYL